MELHVSQHGHSTLDSQPETPWRTYHPGDLLYLLRCLAHWVSWSSSHRFTPGLYLNWVAVSSLSVFHLYFSLTPSFILLPSFSFSLFDVTLLWYKSCAVSCSPITQWWNLLFNQGFDCQLQHVLQSHRLLRIRNENPAANSYSIGSRLYYRKRVTFFFHSQEIIIIENEKETWSL